MNLIEFLLARIAENEALARAAARHGPVWDDGGPGAVQDARTVVASVGALAHSGRGVAEVEPHVLGHILAHDPTRVLAECEAKRRLIAHLDRMQHREMYGADPTEGVWEILALPYADHPDYRKEWALAEAES